MDQLLRVQNVTVSSDGFGAGEHQTLERPFGHADPAELFAWAGATASWPMRSDPGGSRGLDDHFTRDYPRNIGAEMIGRTKFSPHRGPWQDHEWQGWWGAEPPFHTPVFVLTHHERPAFTLSDTTIREFLDADLVDTLHVVVCPVELGAGVRLWESPDELRDRFEVDVVPSASGVTHHPFWRK